MINMSKNIVEKTTFSVRINDDKTAEEILKQLNSALKKTKKTHTNIRIRLDYENPDYSLPTESITLVGNTEETEEEWHKRLEHEKFQINRSLSEAERILNSKENLTKKLDEIEKALEKSSLRCNDCGKPESIRYNSFATRGKTIRICNSCLKIRENKINAKT